MPHICQCRIQSENTEILFQGGSAKLHTNTFSHTYSDSGRFTHNFGMSIYNEWHDVCELYKPLCMHACVCVCLRENASHLFV